MQIFRSSRSRSLSEQLGHGQRLESSFFGDKVSGYIYKILEWFQINQERSIWLNDRETDAHYSLRFLAMVISKFMIKRSIL
ncbi:hypothetical protein RRG08_033691 [Elysia crispata]|uniref:Uncharacterized protein n=1 Tax=Elysia crispata TaxID=231223 RepID=A0AAE1AAG5_9GAST|nr:hypothetical protein RRG08_033691 [Elysia crispata]